MKWDSDNVFITKYADDTIICGLINSDDVSEYKNCVKFVNEWCCMNFLQLNAAKTKELTLDFRRRSTCHYAVTINDMPVQTCEMYKYLGIFIDNKLRFADHVDYVYKKSIKKLYYVRSLVKLKVDTNIIHMFFNAVIIPSLTYCCIAYYQHLSVDLKTRLDKPGKICGKLTRCQNAKNELMCIADLHRREVILCAKRLIKDSKHPLHKCFELMPSGRRYRMTCIKTTRYRNSFLPTALRFLNDTM